MSDWQFVPGGGSRDVEAAVDWSALDAATERMRQASEAARAAAEDLAAAVTSALSAGVSREVVAERARIDRETLERIELTGQLY